MTPKIHEPSSAAAETRYLSAPELAARWSMSAKTLERWRATGFGPLFAKISKKVLYPLDGPEGVLAWERRSTRRSTAERAFG